MTRISVGSDFGKISFMRSPETLNPPGVESEVVLIVSAGDTWNSRGIAWVQSYEDEKRILLRVRHASYQTSGGADAVRPWGVFVLPLPEGLRGRDQRPKITSGGRRSGRRFFRAAKLPDPAKQLEQVPVSDKRGRRKGIDAEGI